MSRICWAVFRRATPRSRTCSKPPAPQWLRPLQNCRKSPDVSKARRRRHPISSRHRPGCSTARWSVCRTSPATRSTRSARLPVASTSTPAFWHPLRIFWVPPSRTSPLRSKSASRPFRRFPSASLAARRKSRRPCARSRASCPAPSPTQTTWPTVPPASSAQRD